MTNTTDLSSLQLGGTSQTFDRPKGEYPVIEKGMRDLQIYRLQPVMEPDYNDRTKQVPKLRLHIVVANPADKVNYGRTMLLSVTPKVTAPDPSRGSKGQESNLYKIIKDVLNDGNELTREQLQRYWDDPNNLTDLLYANFSGLVRVKTYTKQDKTQGQKNVIEAFDTATGDYPPFERVYTPDARNYEEGTAADQSIVCATTGEVVWGFETGNGEFFSQAQFVALQDGMTKGTKYEGNRYSGRAWGAVRDDINETGGLF